VRVLYGRLSAEHAELNDYTGKLYMFRNSLEDSLLDDTYMSYDMALWAVLTLHGRSG